MMLELLYDGATTVRLLMQHHRIKPRFAEEQLEFRFCLGVVAVDDEYVASGRFFIGSKAWFTCLCILISQCFRQ
jgi:hypothetical protein